MALIQCPNRCVKITGEKVFNYPTLEERAKIKELLTFENPNYTKAKRYSRYVSKISPYLHYYSEDKKSITVPVGFNLDPILSTREVCYYDTRIKADVMYPDFVLELRETQQEAFKSYMQGVSNIRYPKNIVQLPTGKGKTILGLSIACALKQRTLIIVHKVDLLNGWKKDILKAFNGKLTPHILQGTKNVNYGKQITIATIQTLNRLSEKDIEMLSDKFGLIIQDEMHHCPASSYEVSLNFKAKYRLGLTATPERSDGLDHVMNLYYGDFAYKYENRVDDKDILPVEIKHIKAPVYFNPICTQRGGKWFFKSITDFTAGKDIPLGSNQKRISDIEYKYRPKVMYSDVDSFVVNSELLRKDLIERITLEHKLGHSVVVFFSQKEQVKLFYDLLSPLFKSKVFTYYGDNPEKVNAEVLEKVENVRDTITLTTYAKATEGTNVNQWEVEFLVSSINNGKNVEQALGRIRRVSKKEKLQVVRVYDYDYSDCFMLKGHTFTRKERYRKMGFLQSETLDLKGIFKKGI